MWWMGASESPVKCAFTPSQKTAGAAASAQKPRARARSLVRSVEERGEERHVHPAVVADQPGGAEEQGGEEGLPVQEQPERAEKEGEKHRLAGAGGARLDVQGREREPQRRPECRALASLPCGDAAEQPDARESARERQRPGGEHAIAEQPDESAEEGEVERAVLVGFEKTVPEMRLRGPALRQLDAHRRVAVVLVPPQRRRDPGEQRDGQGAEGGALQRSE